jgi:hypothetical protein
MVLVDELNDIAPGECDPALGDSALPRDPLFHVVRHPMDGVAPFARQGLPGEREIVHVGDFRGRDVVQREVQRLPCLRRYSTSADDSVMTEKRSE